MTPEERDIRIEELNRIVREQTEKGYEPLPDGTSVDTLRNELETLKLERLKEER